MDAATNPDGLAPLVAPDPSTCHVGQVIASDPKSALHNYLRSAREAMVWKCSGLSEYDLRRTLTPTGTNLLRLVKHLASVEVGCFAWAFDRPLGETFWWLEEDDDAEPNADMWATEDEPSPVDLPRACAHPGARRRHHRRPSPDRARAGPWREPSEVRLTRCSCT